MISPETLHHKRIDEDNRHDKPGELGNTIRICSTDNDNPECVTNQIDVKEPGVILVFVFTDINKVVCNSYCHSTI